MMVKPRYAKSAMKATDWKMESALSVLNLSNVPNVALLNVLSASRAIEWMPKISAYNAAMNLTFVKRAQARTHVTPVCTT
jgi:hypothetical protein